MCVHTDIVAYCTTYRNKNYEKCTATISLQNDETFKHGRPTCLF